MNKKILLALIILIGCLLTACSNSEVAENDVRDDTVFTPPEQEEGITGVWSCQFSNLTQNNYFYGDGKFVSILQDIEEETWCTMALWSEDDNKITLKDQIYYKYNPANSGNQKWERVDSPIGFVSATHISETQIDVDEVLPDGNTLTVNNTREAKDIQVPSDVEINIIINDFLIH